MPRERVVRDRVAEAPELPLRPYDHALRYCVCRSEMAKPIDS